jgi:hypothetical protein
VTVTVESAESVTGSARALAAVLRLHRPWKLYTDCDHNHEPGDGSVEIEDIGLTCEVMYDICRECCGDGGDGRDGQSEICASEHAHGKDLPICRTAAAIAAAQKEAV